MSQQVLPPTTTSLKQLVSACQVVGQARSWTVRVFICVQTTRNVSSTHM